MRGPFPHGFLPTSSVESIPLAYSDELMGSPEGEIANQDTPDTVTSGVARIPVCREVIKRVTVVRSSSPAGSGSSLMP